MIVTTITTIYNPNEHRCKTLLKTLANIIHQYIQRIIFLTKWDFSQKYMVGLVLKKSITASQYIQIKKNKIHSIIPIDARKAFDKIQKPLIKQNKTK